MAACYNSLGDLHMDAGNLDEAVEAYQKKIAVQERLMAQNPAKLAQQMDLVRSLIGLGNLQRLAEHLDEAVSSCEKVVDMVTSVAEKKRSAAHWALLGEALYRLGRWQESREALESGFRLRRATNPTLAAPWWYLTMALAQLGEKDQARSYNDQLVAALDAQEKPAETHQQLRAEAAELPDGAAARSADTHCSVQAQISTLGSTDATEFFRSVAQLGIQAAEALDHAHQQGIVHRDIKPSNLMVDPQGHLYVTDFGLAHMQSETSLTISGDVLGTLRYMSPEQARGERRVLDHRTDIYSLGATLYELLTLQPAFAGKDRRELLREVLDLQPRRPRELNEAIPADLETIVLTAMANDPQARYGTAQELADDLRRYLAGQAIHAEDPSVGTRPKRWLLRRCVACAAALFVTAALVLTLVFLFSPEREDPDMSSPKSRTAALVLALSSLLGTSTEAKPPKPPPPPPPVLYEITWMGDAFPRDVNNLGEVVGGSGWGFPKTAQVSTAETLGVLTDLNEIADVPDGYHAEVAWGINEHGWIVGNASEPEVEGSSTAFLYDPSAIPNFVLLPKPPSGYPTVAERINDSGDIVGHAVNELGEQWALLWKRSYDSEGRPSYASVVDLGQQLAESISTDIAINNNGVIVTKGVRLTPNEVGGYDVESFEGLHPHALNDVGDFVGDTQFYGNTPSTKKRLYDGAFRFTGLDPTAPEEILYQWQPATGLPRPQAVAWDINSAKQVCLWGRTESGDHEAFLYTNEHGLLDLSDLVTGDPEDVDRWNAAIDLRPFAISEPYIPPNPEDEATGFPLIVLVGTPEGLALLTPKPVPVE